MNVIFVDHRTQWGEQKNKIGDVVMVNLYFFYLFKTSLVRCCSIVLVYLFGHKRLTKKKI